jgi:acetate kinase
MVTGGATPLEGLPGETTCGDLDPTIILTLAREMKWGPEQINNVLTRQSGLRGLLGRPMRLGRLIGSSRWASADGRLRQAPEGTLAAARGFVAYRILLAAGAGVAAMGGFDRLVLTGRYGAEGQAMSRQLVERLCQANGRTERPPVIVCPTPLSRIVADQAVATALQETGEFRRPESAEAIPMNAPSA